jgi:methanesulfonate monooxygenase subunit alpha
LANPSCVADFAEFNQSGGRIFCGLVSGLLRGTNVMSRNSTEWARPPALPDDHYVSSLVYSDESLFQEEQEKIMRKTWRFACHETEVPEVGDYRTFDHAGYPLLVIRGDDMKIRTFINTCPHRSATIARGPSGNAKTLTCFFHLWSFDTHGNCVSITRDEGYETVDLKKEDCGLREVKTAHRLGMVYVNLDDDSESFDDYIGNSFDMIEECMGTEPLEIFHFHKVNMQANWKQWHETNMELYHEWGHVVNRLTCIAADGYHDRLWNIHDNGHGTLEPLNVKYGNYKGWEDREDGCLPGLEPGELRVVDLFPNTTIIVRATTVRIDTSTPIGPGLTRLESRGLGIKGESAEERTKRRNNYNEFWGPFGRNLSEDVFFVEAVERSNREGAAKFGILARHENLLSQDDEIMRAYYNVWSRHMGRPASNPKNLLATAAE